MAIEKNTPEPPPAGSSTGSSQVVETQATEKKPEELTPVTKLAILRFLAILFTPPAVVVALLSFYLGNIIQQGANAIALTKALDAVQAVLPKLTDSAISAADVANRSKISAENAEQAANKAKKEDEQLEQGLKDLGELEKALKAKTEFATDVANVIVNDEALKGQISKALPAITLLDTAQQYAFVNHNTGELHAWNVHNMPADGFTVDCSGKVPAKANGVIIAVLIVGEGAHKATYFVCSDANGSFSESLNKQAVNGIYNYSGAWMSGILFCPFLKDTNQFKYLIGQFDEKDTHCRGTLVGWF